MDGARQQLPLEGVRVLDLGQVWAGPQLGCYLGDMGAEVVLIQSAPRAAVSPGLLAIDGVTDPEDPRAYNGLGRNRLSVSLNLAHPDGRAIFLRLVEQSDVVFDNFSPRAIRELDIGYDVLAGVNPKIIVASLSATGREGQWSDLLTYGPSLAALYGYKSLLGYPEDGLLQEDISDLDPTAATFALVPILAALRSRRRTGKGEFIDLAQGAALLAMLAGPVLDYTMNGRVSGPTGNRHDLMAPYGVYPAAGADAWVAIAVDTDAAWVSLCRVMGHAGDPAAAVYASGYSRLRHRHDVDDLLGRWTASWDAEELAGALQEAGVGSYPVVDTYGALNDVQLEHRRDGRFAVDGATITSAEIYTGMPWRFSLTPPQIRSGVKPIGADNALVLQGILGLTDDEMQIGIESGAIV